jgi:hypothetical protein
MATIRYCNKKLYAYFFILLLVPVAAGCGYHFRATGETMGMQLESIAIPMMESTSSNIGFEADFTRVIREEFISHARVPLVSQEKAQMVLIGRIHEIRTDPLTYDIQLQNIQGSTSSYDTTESRRIQIGLTAELVDRAGGKTLWREESMEEKASFKVGTDPLVNRFNQKQAMERIARRLAKRIYMKTMERF